MQCEIPKCDHADKNREKFLWLLPYLRCVFSRQKLRGRHVASTARNGHRDEMSNSNREATKHMTFAWLWILSTAVFDSILGIQAILNFCPYLWTSYKEFPSPDVNLLSGREHEEHKRQRCCMLCGAEVKTKREIQAIGAACTQTKQEGHRVMSLRNYLL